MSALPTPCREKSFPGQRDCDTIVARARQLGARARFLVLSSEACAFSLTPVNVVRADSCAIDTAPLTIFKALTDGLFSSCGQVGLVHERFDGIGHTLARPFHLLPADLRVIAFQ
jgi:hypothetical protein